MDIYFSEDYAKLYEKNNQKYEIFKFENECGKGYYIFLKRYIYGFEGWCDIVSPYGYGGPIFEYTDENEKINGEFRRIFFIEFTKYCEEKNIIAEFVMFHPILKNYEQLENFYDIKKIGSSIAMELESEKQIFENMDSKCRNKVRKAQKNSLKVLCSKEKEYVDEFIKIYKITMDKNIARSFYYFDEKYFDGLFKSKKTLLFSVMKGDKVVGATIIILGENIIHYHLSANTEVGYKMAANNLLLNEIAKWGSENGYKYFHLGGGLGNDESPLYAFKRSFSNKIFERYIGKKIHDDLKYNQVCQEFERKFPELKEKSKNYFPQYRY